MLVEGAKLGKNDKKPDRESFFSSGGDLKKIADGVEKDEDDEPERVEVSGAVRMHGEGGLRS